MLSPSDAASQIIFQNHLHLVGACLLFYDHLLTLDTEINYLWKRRKLASAYWFFAIRCLVWSLVYEISIFVGQLGISVVMILRIYCLWERSKRVLSSLAVIGAILTGAALIQTSPYSLVRKGRRPPRSQVHLPYSILLEQNSELRQQYCPDVTHTYQRERLAGSWAALFIFDSIVFGLTVANGWKMRRRMGPDSALGSHAARTLIVRDVSNLAQRGFIEILHRLIRMYFPALLQRSQIGSISITMMARLILNLHAQAEGGIFTVNHMDVNVGGSMLSDGNMPFASRTEIENPNQRTD
ncbi:hypothetical protein R3P38DRAFT_2814372 [Favolaschia claudopus]|uniref:DUF6533 domain-containing protein n=1 Tax=Favolaschia claudopus TaxID=2862362 RepID=A0AAV9Z3E7_9AGAR